MIIPHFEDLEPLRDCLSALLAQSEQPSEIIIADNGSQDSAARVAGLAAEVGLTVTVIFIDERGAGPARNGGAQIATGDMIAFLDADCRPHSDWVTRGKDATQTVGIVGGPVHVTRQDGRKLSTEEAWDVLFGHDAEKSHRRHNHLLGGNIFMTRAIFQRVGGFRNGYPEDRDWCERAAAMGYRIGFDPLLIVSHPPLADYSGLERRWIRMTQEEFVRGQGRSRGILKFALHNIAVLFSVVPHAAHALTSPEIQGAKRWPVIVLLARLRYLRFALACELIIGGGSSMRHLGRRQQ